MLFSPAPFGTCLAIHLPNISRVCFGLGFCKDLSLATNRKKSECEDRRKDETNIVPPSECCESETAVQINPTSALGAIGREKSYGNQVKAKRSIASGVELPW